MSDAHDRLDEIGPLCQKLADLLNDPHPGLSTWVGARQHIGEQLLGALTYAMSPAYLPEIHQRVQQFADGEVVGVRVADVQELLKLSARAVGDCEGMS